MELGPFTIALSTSRTAQTFHVVDELAAWHPGAKRSPYVAWAASALPLDADEKAMLAGHAKLRRRRGWGALDQAFLVDASIDDAARSAVENRLVTSADADVERATLAHFAERLAPLFDAQRARLEAFASELPAEIERAAPTASRLVRFFAIDERAQLPVFLASDPSPLRGDGSFHGGALVVEVLARGEGDAAPAPGVLVDARDTFFHAAFHALLAKKRESIAIAAAKCDDPLDEETLTEALAYAIAPGILHGSDRDPLGSLVAAEQGRSLRAPDARFARLGLAIRDPLAAALDGQGDYHAFFPKACEAWGRVRAAAR
jgi:hypothetical protein